MTWIIGRASMFGYAAAISDVQVSWNDKATSLDCLQKIYVVAPFMVAGFAGSVKIGFDLVRDLRVWISNEAIKGGFVSPRAVAEKWKRRARWVFNQESTHLQKLGASLLLAGISANERIGDLQGPRADVVLMHSNDGFTPRYAKLMEAVSIGSGRTIVEYAAALQDLDGLLGLEAEFAGAFTLGLGFRIGEVLRDHPVFGVSKYLQLAEIRPEGVTISELRQSFSSVDGLPAADPIPPIVSSWSEFEQLAKQHGLRAAEATTESEPPNSSLSRTDTALSRCPAA